MRRTLSKMIHRTIIILCLIFIETIHSTENNYPVITVREGKLRGSVVTAVQGFSYYSFKGIPYARPPVGSLRFKAPLPPQPWPEIRDATEYGPVCAQFNVTFVGSEDCLFLNIYTRSLNKHAKTPVMLFIHGGSFAAGSGNDFFGPDFLIQHDVILVTINYRQEVLGYLSLDIPEVSGNAGMKDQVAALKWIHNNIDKFGGDPNSVTIFGESSGASSVTYHMLSPMSKGLFHKVIAESGSCIQDWAVSQGAVERAFRAGKLLGKDTNDVYELLNFFLSLNASALTNLTFKTLTNDELYRGVPARFVPGVEKNFNGVQAFIDEHPVSLLAKGKFNKVPLMIGYNSGEGIVLVTDQISKLDVFNKQPSYYVQKEIANIVSKEKLKEFGARIKKFYVGDRNITSEDGEIIKDMQTDITFAYSIHRLASLYSALAPVYFYRFNYVTELNVLKTALPDLEGASHGDELFYIFSNYVTTKFYEIERLRAIINKVTKLWTDFAKSGYPTPDRTHGVTWPLYSKRNKQFLNIEDSFSVGYYADKERIEFWDKIYSEAGVPHILH